MCYKVKFNQTAAVDGGLTSDQPRLDELHYHTHMHWTLDPAGVEFCRQTALI